MTKAKNWPFNQTKLMLLGIIGILILVSLTLSVVLVKGDDDNREAELTKSGMHINLGSLQYSIREGKATKREDASVNNLTAFLIEEAGKSLESGCDSVYYNVTAYTSDETQVLLTYGCNYPNARMFAVKGSEGWKTVSPTSQFDIYGIPTCAHVNQNGIHKAIAPVCVSEWGQDPNNVRYIVR